MALSALSLFSKGDYCVPFPAATIFCSCVKANSFFVLRQRKKKVILPWVFLLPHKLDHGHVVLCTVFLFYFHFQFIVLKRTNKHVFCPFLFPELNKNPVEGFSAGLIDDDDIYKWEVVIIGPQDTLL